MPDEFVKDTQSLSVEAIPPLRLHEAQPLPTVQAQKNTVLYSHGRPPW